MKKEKLCKILDTLGQALEELSMATYRPWVWIDEEEEEHFKQEIEEAKEFINQLREEKE